MLQKQLIINHTTNFNNSKKIFKTSLLSTYNPILYNCKIDLPLSNNLTINKLKPKIQFKLLANDQISNNTKYYE